MPKTIQQRVAEYRARMKSKGYEQLSCYVPGDIKKDLLRMIAERVSQYEEGKK